MSTYAWGTLYFVPHDWDGEDESILETHADQVSNFEKAEAIWRLAGREDRAATIARVLDRACARDREIILNEQDLAELEPTFQGLDAAIIGPVLDEHLRVPTERLPELREQFPAFDLREGGGLVPETGIGSALGDVEGLGRRLREARARGVHVRLDFSR